MADTFTLDPEADDQKLLAQVVAFYRQTLTNSPPALDYLREQGITNAKAIEHFKIGYADRSLGLKLPRSDTKPGGLIRERLQRLGLFRSSGHEHFTGCVVFPITAGDGSNQIKDLYGKKILGNRLRKGTLLDVFLSDKRHGVWNIDAFPGTEEIILCPSLLDALILWNHGFRNVTCTFDNNIPTDHLAAFTEFKIKRVLTPIEAITPQLIEAGLDCYLLRLPTGKTIHTYALEANNPADALAAILRKAEWAGKGQEPVRIDAEAKPEPEAKLVAKEPVPQTASPLPPAPQADEVEEQENEVAMTFGSRRYRVRGLPKNLAYDTLRVNLLASSHHGMFVDTFDLYSARHRKTFTVQASQELAVEEEIVKKDVGRVLLKLEELQDKQIKAALEPKEITPTMDDEEKEAALRFLHDPSLLDNILTDFSLVGECTNKLVGYLAAVSRKLDQPLAIIIQSSSAAGKTALMDAILSFVPAEDVTKFSAMTGQSLFYMGETNLKHKLLAIVEEEGAERACYALKLLQSEGELTIASTGKEVSTGRLVTQEYKVEGPVMLFLTTTAIKIDEELLNRCIVLTVDENREQTRAIHCWQRKRQTLQGLLAAQDQHAKLTLHRNAQRLLRPILVANPHAEQLTFLDDKTRTRRDHIKYLTLIRAITLLHQYQRPIKTVEHNGKDVEYIEVAVEDIEVANRLACEVLGRSLDDLPPQTRNLLILIDQMVTSACQEQGIDRADYRFSRRDIREHASWGHTQLKVHLKRLEELEYLLVHTGGRGKSIAYELIYEPPQHDGQKFLASLIDVDQLRRNLSVSSRCQSRIKVASSRGTYDAESNGGTEAKSTS